MIETNDNKYTRDFIYTCPSRVFKDNSLTKNELSIYMIVRSFMDSTGSAYPSNNWIASEIDCSRATVIRAINKLVDKSYLYRIEINGRRHLTFTMPILEELVSPVIRGVSPVIRGGITGDTGGGITSDTQLDHTTITSKIITLSKQTEIEQKLFINSEQQRQALILKEECRKEVKCKALYEKLSQDIKQDKSFDDVHDECVIHYATQLKPQIVSPQRLISWINRELRHHMNDLVKIAYANKPEKTMQHEKIRWTVQSVMEA